MWPYAPFIAYSQLGVKTAESFKALQGVKDYSKENHEPLDSLSLSSLWNTIGAYGDISRFREDFLSDTW